MFLYLLATLVVRQMQAQTIRIPARAGVDEVTFDSTRVPVAEVRRWLQLSPNMDNAYMFPEEADQCFGNDPRYQGCGKTQEGLNLHNAQLNVERIRQRLSGLEPSRYPDDLAPVVAYVRRIQSFGLWVDGQLIAFAKVRDLSALSSQFDGVDPSAPCGTILNHIVTAESEAAALHLALFDWRNCVWGAERKQLGDYPRDAWEKFLANDGIRERYVEQDISD